MKRQNSKRNLTNFPSQYSNAIIKSPKYIFGGTNCGLSDGQTNGASDGLADGSVAGYDTGYNMGYVVAVMAS